MYLFEISSRSQLNTCVMTGFISYNHSVFVYVESPLDYIKLFECIIRSNCLKQIKYSINGKSMLFYKIKK